MNDICTGAGAFVIGALEASEDREFARHLADCPECEREVAELAGLVAFAHHVQLDPNLLDDLKAAETERRGPDASETLETANRPSLVLLPTPADQPSGRDSRRPLMVTLVGGLIAAAVAAFLIINPLNDSAPSQPPAAVAMDRAFPNTGDSTIRVQVTGANGSSQIKVLCDIAYSSDGYQTGLVSLWVHTKQGTDLEVTSWPVHVGSKTFPGEVPVPPEEIVSYELRDQTGQLLNTMQA